MAKKRKAARPASRSAKKKKKAVKKKTARRPRAAAAAPVALAQFDGLSSEKQIHFGPLKTQIRAHIERLRSVQQPSTAVQNALRSLEQVQADLTVDCSPTMVIPTP